jgi:squalene-hopene/tetraprenyl-beta-curcumene cyclase
VSQTSWAILGLLCTEERRSESVEKGIEFLIKNQNEDGTWDEEEFTGTGFPKVFYLRYHMYRSYFPLLALSRYRNMVK